MKDAEKIWSFDFPKVSRRPGFGWIYFLHQAGKVVYVGQTTESNPICRIAQHVKDKQFDGYSFFEVPFEMLNYEEARIIKERQPPLNKVGTSAYNLQVRTLAASRLQCLSSVAQEGDVSFSRKDAVAYLSAYCQSIGQPLSGEQRTALYNRIGKVLSPVLKNGKAVYLKSSILFNFDNLMRLVKKVD